MISNIKRSFSTNDLSINKSLKSHITTIKKQADINSLSTQTTFLNPTQQQHPLASHSIYPQSVISGLTRSHSTDKLHLEESHQELWEQLEEKSVHLRKIEIQNIKTWCLEGIDRFIGIGSNPKGRMQVIANNTVPMYIRGGQSIPTIKYIDMNANSIALNGKDLAIVAQYPTNISPNNVKPINMNEELCRHIHLLLYTQAPALIVLVSQADMNKGLMLPYFSRSLTYNGGDTQTYITPSHSKEEIIQKNTEDELVIASHHMKITHGRKPEKIKYEIDEYGIPIIVRPTSTYELSHNLPVIHIKNAPGRKGTFTVKQLQELAKKVNDLVANHRIDHHAESELSLPVIIDSSGTGPAAQMVIAMHLIEKAKSQSMILTDHIEQMVYETRQQRNSHMIETQKQFDVLLDLVKTLRK